MQRVQGGVLPSPWDPVQEILNDLEAQIMRLPAALDEPEAKRREAQVAQERALLTRWAVLQAHRGDWDFSVQRSRWLQVPLRLRELYWQALREAQAPQPLLQSLRKTPDPSGWRLESVRHAHVWQTQLRQLWDKETKEGVRVDLLEEGQIVSRTLHPSFAEQVLDAKGCFKPKDPRQSGNHRLYPLQQGSSTLFWMKLFPEQPGTEGVMLWLDQALGVFGIPCGQLLKVYTSDAAGQLRGHAVYLSEHVPGDPLDTVLKTSPEQLDQLTPRSFVSSLLRVLLTNPEDDKGDDYFLVPLREGGCALHRIDNERAFFEPFAGQNLQVKSILYCLDAMAKPLAARPEGQAVLADFLRLGPLSLIGQLLDALAYAQPLWQKLFTEEEVVAHFKEPNSLSLPVLIWAEGLEKELLNRLTAMQTVLKLNPQATSLDLLSAVQPKLGNHYRKIHQHLPSLPGAPYRRVLQRFSIATPKGYTRDVQGRLYTNLAGPAAVSRSFRLKAPLDEKTVRSVYAGRQLSLVQAQRAFAELQKQRGDQILAGLKEIGADEKAQALRQQAKVQFQQLPLRHKTVLLESLLAELKHLTPPSQRLILEAMVGTPWHHLSLSGFAGVFNRSLLRSLIEGAGGHLLSLDVSGVNAI